MSGLDKMTERISKAFDAECVPSRRRLNNEDLLKLQQACSQAFGSKIHEQVIEKVMNYCCFVDSRMKGRAAGNIEDLIIRYLVRYFGSLTQPNEGRDCCHLEIGVLFGATVIFTCHAVDLAEEDITTTVIDPFEGYYGKEADPGTGLKADEKTFWENLERFSIPQNRIKVFKGLSTDEDIIKNCRKLKVLSLIIDGDHSYQGVKKDWMNYAPLVVSGGFVLLDDYNSHAWPEVTRFVNTEVLSNLAGLWEVALVFGHSILLKRTNAAETEKSKYAETLLHKLKGAERELEAQACQITRQTEQIACQTDRIAALEKTIAKQTDALDKLHMSLSWRLTAPLRYLGGIVRKKDSADASEGPTCA